MISKIDKKDNDAAAEIATDYLDEGGVLMKHLDDNPDLVLGYYEGSEIVGIVYGHPRDGEEVILQGIAIKEPFNKQGKGKELLLAFEQAVKKAGYLKISVGSADGYVEKFYLDNGYQPIEFLVRAEAMPEGYNAMFWEVTLQEKNEDGVVLKVKTDTYDLTLKKRAQEEFNATEVCYIFEKVL